MLRSTRIRTSAGTEFSVAVVRNADSGVKRTWMRVATGERENQYDNLKIKYILLKLFEFFNFTIYCEHFFTI